MGTRRPWKPALRLSVCVIRTVRVEVVEFRNVTEEFAATEGEGDGRRLSAGDENR